MLSDFGVLDHDARSPRRVVPAPLHWLIVVLQRFLHVAGAAWRPRSSHHRRSAAPASGAAGALRLWSNLDGDGPPLLQVLLSGQPELDSLLGRPEMRQVRQRVSRRCELTGLERDEVAEYIEHRLSVARGPDTRQEPGRAGRRRVRRRRESVHRR